MLEEKPPAWVDTLRGPRLIGSREFAMRIRPGFTALVVVGLVTLGTASAVAAPGPLGPVITAGCQDDGDTFVVDVVVRGAVAFVVDDEGTRTGEKLFLRSIDAAAFTDAGVLVEEFHKTYGQRTGHGDPVFCSGSFVEDPGVTVFFDALVTRR
jgi:hypothetical protein